MLRLLRAFKRSRAKQPRSARSPPCRSELFPPCGCPRCPPSATLLHLLRETLSAFPGISSSSPIFAVPVNLAPCPLPAVPRQARSRFPAAFPRHAAPPGAGSHPPRLLRFPPSPPRATAAREMLGASGQRGLRDGGQRATAEEEPGYV